MSYDELLRKVIEKTGITFISPHVLPVDGDLYEIEANDYL